MYRCAGYLGHLFTKSESCASTIAPISYLAFMKRRTGPETREQASQCSMNILHTPISSTKLRSNIFSSSVEENAAGNAKTPSHLDTTILFRRTGFTCSL
jgi:hypothetical protein